MKTFDFLKYYFLTLAVLAVLLYGMSYNTKVAEYLDISYIAIPVFSVLCFGIFFFTNYIATLPNKNAMLTIVIYNVMFKFLLSIGIVAIYHKAQKPEDGIFVLPFIVIYVIFTIFETYFMSVQAKN